MSITRRKLIRQSIAIPGGLALAGTFLHVHGQFIPKSTPEMIDTELLVDARDLIEIEPAPQLLAVMDVTTFQTFHVAGTIQMGWEELSLSDTSDQSISAWTTQMRELFAERGIRADREVVVYDEGTLFAARGWWQLAWLGYESVRILDEGLPAWNEAGGEVEEGKPEANPREAPVFEAQPRLEFLATKGEVLATLEDPNVLIVDARGRGEYDDGHIPGAVNVTYTDNAVDGGGSIYLPSDRLREMYEAVGMTDGKRAITYCSTGVRGSVAAFAMCLAGFRDVALYIGSWSEWSGYPDAPVE